MNQWIVLYCLINNKEKSGHILSLLRKEYFYEELPQKVFLYIVELFQKNIAVTETLVKSRYPEAQFTEVDIDHYEEYIENLRKVYVNSEIKKIGKQIVNKPEIDESKFADYIDDFLNDIRANKKDQIEYAPEIIDSLLKDINSEEEITSPVKYGIKELDNLTKGLFPGDYIVIAGRPSMGKSAIMGHIAITNALNGVPTLLFSLEMSAKKIMERMIADICDLEIWKLKRLKNRSQQEQDRVIHIASQLKAAPIIIDSTSSLDINSMQSTIQKVKIKYDLGLIVIDYLQLMSGEGLNDNSRIGQISKNMKMIAVKYNLPVIAGSQLSRLCEQRENKRPVMSDLRDSGNLEQDADIILMLYRDQYYSSNPDHERILEVAIRKFRNGETGKIIVDYNRKSQHFQAINYETALGKIAKKFQFE